MSRKYSITWANPYSSFASYPSKPLVKEESYGGQGRKYSITWDEDRESVEWRVESGEWKMENRTC